MPDQITKLTFPTLRRIVLRRFSLFSLAHEVDESLPTGVFCLAGANGLGKSTFLAAANYGLTGIVSDPGQRFASVGEYYGHSLEFAREYFRGRISERDRKAAEVSLEIDVGKQHFCLTRGAFEPTELRALTVLEGHNTLLDGTAMSAEQRQTKYAELITASIGLDSFEQFVFLQHFILTFDERRHLLFWDPRVLEQALFLAFGVDHASARRADSLRREAERADSLARNANWQASAVRKKIADLRKTVAGLTPDATEDLFEEHEALTKANDKTQAKLERLEAQQRDQSLRLAELSSKQVSLRADYTREFSQRIQTTTHVAHHSLITSSIDAAACGLCGTQGKTVADAIRKRVQATECPICGSDIEKERARAKDIARLKQLDEAIGKNKESLDEVVSALQRLETELQAASSAHNESAKKLKAFEKENAALLSQLDAEKKGGGVAAVLAAYHQQMTEFLEEKKEQYDRRDERRRDLKRLTDTLEEKYSQAEELFVPAFKDLAHKFIGLDLDIQMEVGASAGATLVLEVKSAARREHHQLSESQRFFIDIALRMALAQFMSGPNGRASLFVDTPEGSLDIAYEKRAGNMLASFVEAGFNLLMTANINSSRLLVSLAEKLGRKRMHLCRMTSWAELSEVQDEEEELFDEAYRDIEEALDGKRKARRK